MRKVFPLALLAAPLALLSCNGGDSFKKTKSGVEYKIVKDEKGSAAQMGDKMDMTIQVRLVHNGDSKDTIVQKVEKTGGNVPPPSYAGDWVEGFTMLSAGDSAVFRVSVDTLQKLQGSGPLPPFIHKGAMIQYEVKLLSLTPDPQARAAMQERVKMMEEYKKKGGRAQQPQQSPPPPAAANQPAADDKILQDYFAKAGLSPKKTASGLYYIIDNPGNGAAINAGQTVTVSYTGKTLDGKTFDSNEDPAFHHTQPFDFALGRGSVIPGWDEGVALVKKGGKIRLFIPSGLAYGPAQPSELIGPNSVLTFNVAVKDVK